MKNELKKMNFIVFILLLTVNIQAFAFKQEQLRYPRVRQAYAEKGELVNSLLNKHNIRNSSLRLYLRAFKQEQKIEVWAKNSYDEQFVLIKEYDVCGSSGTLGPKRRQGDRQIPEGFYHINRFNPSSNFHLSLGINYPNQSDKILGESGNLGDDIFIHGACVTIGCLPITDDKIKELYVFCVEARNAGQTTIPVTIFPARLTQIKFTILSLKYKNDSDKIPLWQALKKAYDIFNEAKKLPRIEFLSDGRHNVF
jgi:murein L,D-transpeptidase YafK